MPTHFHAIVWIDHSQAKVFHIGLSGEDEVILHPHLPTKHIHHKASAFPRGVLRLLFEVGAANARVHPSGRPDRI